MLERLDDRDVSIGEHKVARIEVFSDDADLHNFGRGFYSFGEFFPLGKAVLFERPDAELLEDEFAQVVLLEVEGDVVDRFNIGSRDDAPLFKPTHVFELFFALRVNGAGRACEDHVGVETRAVEEADRMLGRLGLELVATDAERRDVAYKHEKYVT